MTTVRPAPPRPDRAPPFPLITVRLVALATALLSFIAASAAVVTTSRHLAGTSLPGEVALLVALTVLAAPLTAGGCVTLIARLSGVARPRRRRPSLVPAAALVVALVGAVLLTRGWTAAPSLALAGLGSCALGMIPALPIDRARASTVLAALDVLAGAGIAAAALATGTWWLLPAGALLELTAAVLAWPSMSAGTA